MFAFIFMPLFVPLTCERRSLMFQDITGATQHLRHAKGLDQMITVSKSGLPIDISKVRNTR